MWAISDDNATVDNPCVWPLAGDCDLDDTTDDEIVELAQQAAIEILHAASGRQFGQCVGTWRPCRATCMPTFEQLDMWQVLDIRNAGVPSSSFQFAVGDGGYGARMVCGACGSPDCSCVDLESIKLWHRNIVEIVEVQLDGVIFDPANYRLWKRRLIRLDGEAWPDCQDFTLDNGDVDTWSISYRHGRPVPAGGQVAAGLLACEISKAMCGDTSCALPKRVQTVTRQGVTVGFLDPMKFLAEGKTGLYMVDLWLQQVNPGRLQRRARVFRADDPRRQRSSVPSWDTFGGS
jgi:hypothetical protein